MPKSPDLCTRPGQKNADKTESRLLNLISVSTAGRKTWLKPDIVQTDRLVFLATSSTLQVVATNIFFIFPLRRHPWAHSTSFQEWQFLPWKVGRATWLIQSQLFVLRCIFADDCIESKACSEGMITKRRQFLKSIRWDRKYSTDVFVSTSEIKAGKEQFDHENIKES